MSCRASINGYAISAKATQSVVYFLDDFLLLQRVNDDSLYSNINGSIHKVFGVVCHSQYAAYIIFMLLIRFIISSSFDARTLVGQFAEIKRSTDSLNITA